MQFRGMIIFLGIQFYLKALCDLIELLRIKRQNIINIILSDPIERQNLIKFNKC
jgi:hypothetical protein